MYENGPSVVPVGLGRYASEPHATKVRAPARFELVGQSMDEAIVALRDVHQLAVAIASRISGSEPATESSGRLNAAQSPGSVLETYTAGLSEIRAATQGTRYQLQRIADELGL